jgi:hypothetical protein
LREIVEDEMVSVPRSTMPPPPDDAMFWSMTQSVMLAVPPSIEIPPPTKSVWQPVTMQLLMWRVPDT